jgi:hypothetical protein
MRYAVIDVSQRVRRYILEGSDLRTTCQLPTSDISICHSKRMSLNVFLRSPDTFGERRFDSETTIETLKVGIPSNEKARNLTVEPV